MNYKSNQDIGVPQKRLNDVRAIRFQKSSQFPGDDWQHPPVRSTQEMRFDSSRLQQSQQGSMLNRWNGPKCDDSDFMPSCLEKSGKFNAAALGSASIKFRNNQIDTHRLSQKSGYRGNPGCASPE
jgi:hypothetical protein